MTRIPQRLVLHARDLSLVAKGHRRQTARRVKRLELSDGSVEAHRFDLGERFDLGAQQSGSRSSLRLLRVLRDEDLIETARHEAIALAAADPALSGHPALAAAITDLLDPEREAYLDRG